MTISYILIPLLTVAVCTANEFDAFSEDEETTTVATSSLHVGEYCAAFHMNYFYYCRGIWTAEKLHKHRGIMKKIGQFCPSYKAACVTRSRFDPEEDREQKEEHQKELKKDVGDMVFDDLMRKLEKIVPCRPNCNIQQHPHCTRRCKCEYEYNRVQKWCNPSQIEEKFQYFCRIWTMSCAEYF